MLPGSRSQFGENHGATPWVVRIDAAFASAGVIVLRSFRRLTIARKDFCC